MCVFTRNKMQSSGYELSIITENFLQTFFLQLTLSWLLIPVDMRRCALFPTIFPHSRDEVVLKNELVQA